MTPRRPIAILAVAATGLALSACGVPRDGSDRPLRPDQVAFEPIPESTTTTTTTSTTTTTIVAPSTTEAPTTSTTAAPTFPFSLFWIQNNQVVRVRRQVPVEPTLEIVVTAFIEGPDLTEAINDLRTALPLPSSIVGVSAEAGTATVELDASFLAQPGQTQILGLAQIVYTVTGVPGIGQVRFVLGGRRVAVPRADGQATTDPVSRDDYKALLSPVNDGLVVPTTPSSTDPVRTPLS